MKKRELEKEIAALRADIRRHESEAYSHHLDRQAHREERKAARIASIRHAEEMADALATLAHIAGIDLDQYSDTEHFLADLKLARQAIDQQAAFDRVTTTVDDPTF